MATALHPQTQLTFKYDGEILPLKYGFPLRVRIPTKLGFKNPKHVIGLAVLNNYTGGYWGASGVQLVQRPLKLERPEAWATSSGFASEPGSFENFVRQRNERIRHSEIHCLGCFQIDHEQITRRLLEWQIGGFRALEYALDQRGGAII